MAALSPSALVTDQGQRVLLRLRGQHYDMSQEELRAALGLPKGPPGLGITIEGDRLSFEFAIDEQKVEMTASQLYRRLGQAVPSK